MKKLPERYLDALNAINAVWSNEDDLEQTLGLVQRPQFRLDLLEQDIIDEIDKLEEIL
jgi:hypothetical protein